MSVYVCVLVQSTTVSHTETEETTLFCPHFTGTQLQRMASVDAQMWLSYNAGGISRNKCIFSNSSLAIIELAVKVEVNDMWMLNIDLLFFNLDFFVRSYIQETTDPILTKLLSDVSYCVKLQWFA